MVHEWLARRAHSARDATVERYREMFVADVYPLIGHKRLKDVRPEDVQSMVDAMVERGVSPATVTQCYRALSSALSPRKGGAVALGKIALTPCRGIDLPEAQEPELHVPERDEVKRIIGAAPDEWKPLFEFYRFTGCRRGEALALRWSDLTLDGPHPEVRIGKTALTKKGGGVTIKLPKSKKSRVVNLGPTLVAVLKAWRTEQERQRRFIVRPDCWTGEDHVFTTLPTGNAIAPDSVTHAFGKAATSGGLEGVRLHDLRHAAATRMLEAGEQPLTVSKMLGHANVAFTLQRYGHVTPGMRAQAAATLEATYE
jgi:integrase